MTCTEHPPLVYVAGPLGTNTATQEANVHAACVAADKLIEHGIVPFIPHLNLYWDRLLPHDREYWVRWDLAWLARCDAVLRLPGESAGSDLETFNAGVWGIPVYTEISSVVRVLGWRQEPGARE